MEYRLLGRSGLKVSVFGFGTMTFGRDPRWGIGNTSGADAASQIDACLEAGVNLFDSADLYAGGQSEEVLAEALGNRRQRVLVATKCFQPMGEGVNDLGSSRHHILSACEASLRRLKTDWIDIYQLHNQDLLTPAEETVRALDDLVRAGKVRYVGSSNYAGWTLMKALAVSDRLNAVRFVSQQIQYSLLSRDVENELLPLGLDQGVGALVWSGLANGYLTGKFRGGGTGKARMTDFNILEGADNERARRIVEVLGEIAAAHSGASLAQAALNWLARKPGVSSILIGARSLPQLTDNLAAAAWSLSDAEMARLDEVSSTPPPYPYAHHRLYTHGRSPPIPPLLPPGSV